MHNSHKYVIIKQENNCSFFSFKSRIYYNALICTYGWGNDSIETFLSPQYDTEEPNAYLDEYMVDYEASKQYCSYLVDCTDECFIGYKLEVLMPANVSVAVSYLFDNGYIHVQKDLSFMSKYVDPDKYEVVVYSGQSYYVRYDFFEAGKTEVVKVVNDDVYKRVVFSATFDSSTSVDEICELLNHITQS